MFRIRRNDEQGATAVIVALSLVALLGLMVLTVDVGQLLFKRRAMVNASDAAALAAAQTCAGVTDPAVPSVVANTYAQYNVSAATGGITELVGCRGPAFGHVSVQYGVNQSLFFAGVLGFSGPAQVQTQATAGWGPAREGNPLPIVVYTGQGQGNCDINEDTLTPGTDCYLWYDNDRFNQSAFGYLNLCTADDNCSQGWDVAGDAGCPNVGASLRREWITGDWEGAGNRINWPAATYVCRVSGLSSSDWSELRNRIGDDLMFPVNDCDTQVDSNGVALGCSTTTAPDKYNIVGFIILHLNAVLDSAAQWGGTPFTHCSRNNVDVRPGQVIPLSSIPSGGCPNGSTPSGVQNLTVGGQPPGGNYTYDDATKSVTWTGPAGRQDFEFDWWVDGECGIPPGNSSAVCIKVTTVRVQFKGHNTCNESEDCPDFGVRAVKLCDLAIGSCPEQR
jgi:Flp pilus assembly protein TadG